MASAQLAPAEAVNAYGVTFRDYSVQETPRQKGVRDFYTQQHARMTYDFVQAQHAKHLGMARCEMSIWEAAGAQRDADSPPLAGSMHAARALTRGCRAHPELLNEVVDDSDPDLDLPQARARSSDVAPSNLAPARAAHCAPHAASARQSVAACRMTRGHCATRARHADMRSLRSVSASLG
jgi:hypothetical protein